MNGELRVLDYLKRHGSATVRDIAIDVGTTEGRKYISNLRKKGVPIRKVRETVKNRYNEECWVVRYIYEEHLAEG